MTIAKHKSDILTVALAVITVLSVASLMIVENVDTYIWWQIGIGRNIIDTLTVPTANLYSLLQYGEPYHDSHWLFQIVMAATDRVGGMAGAHALSIVLWSAVLCLVYKTARTWIEPRVVLLLLFMAACASSIRFIPRPEVVTYLMVSAFSYLLQERRYTRPHQLIMFFFLQIIWTNSHGLFVLGPFLACSYLAAAMLSRTGNQGTEVSHLAKLTTVLSLATILPPFGFSGWRYAYRLFNQVSADGHALYKSVYEFMPAFAPAIRDTPNIWAFAALLAISVITTAATLLKRRSDLPLNRSIICAAFAAQAVLHQRNIPLFSIVAVPLIAESLRSYRPELRLKDRTIAVAMVLMLAVAILAVSGWYYVHFRYPCRFGIGASPSWKPASLPDFLRKERFSGNIFNSNSFGGYCLYHGYLPMLDGRFSDYDPDQYEEIESASRDRTRWEGIVTAYDIKGVLLQHGSQEAGDLIPALISDDRWKLVYYDHSISFWVRNMGPWRSFPKADVTWASASRFALPRIEVWLNMASFFATMKQFDTALNCLAGALQLEQQTLLVLELKARMELESGRISEHEQTLASLLQKDPQHVFGLIQSAVNAFYHGDLGKAQFYFDRVCRQNPDDQQVQAVCANYRQWISRQLPKKQ